MSYIERENDNVYLNVVFNHNDAYGSIPSIAEYNVTKTTPILDKCSDFYASVIRFDIPMNLIPLYIMPIIPNQVDPDKTPMIIGISYNGTDFSENLIYFADNTLNAPVQNDPNGQIITPYYYVYTFQNLINALNLALQQVYTTSGLAAALPGILAPFFYFDAATQLINLVVSKYFIALTAPLAAKPLIYINEYLKNYLESFQLSFRGYNQANGKDYIFTLDAANNTYPTDNQAYTRYGTNPNTVPPAAPAVSDYYRYTQEYPAMNNWISLRKIVITTNTIPVNNEFVPATQNNSGINVGFPILTDFIPNLEKAGDSRSIAYYNPTSQYRLVDLISSQPLYKIDLKIYWEDKKGNLYPLFLSIFQQANIKIAFVRKSLYKNGNLALLT